MGKRNRDAGRDLKPSQSEREVNQPATNSERAQPQHSAGDPFPYIYVGLHRSVPSKWQPQASAQTQTQETSENAQPSGYIMRALIAVREIVRRGFTFLDKHHGSVAAIAASIATVATI